MVDPALHGLYPPKSVSRFANVVALCVQPDFRPLMSEVVQSLVRVVQQSTTSGRVFSVSMKFVSALELAVLLIPLNWVFGAYSLSSCLIESGQNLGIGYNAPECTKPSAFTMKSDVYSFGVIMVDLLTGQKPFGRKLVSRFADFIALCVQVWTNRLPFPFLSKKMLVLNRFFPPRELTLSIVSLQSCTELEFPPPMSEAVQSLVRVVQQSIDFGCVFSRSMKFAYALEPAVLLFALIWAFVAYILSSC